MTLIPKEQIQNIINKEILWTPWPDWANARGIEKGGHMFYFENIPKITECGDFLTWWDSGRKLCVGILDMPKNNLDGTMWTQTIEVRVQRECLRGE